MANHQEPAASTQDFKNGDMKQVKVGDTDVLLACVDGQFYAVHAHCTHYGAPLVDGALHGDRVICPWHHACFSVKKGKQCEPPGLDDLPSYEVRVEDGAIYVTVPDGSGDRVTPPMADQDTGTEQLFAVVGGGAAAAYAVEALREADFTGRIVMISADDEVPYDRPNASKDYLQDEAPEEWMPLRSPDFYEQHGIERLYAEVSSVDTDQKTITLSQGDPIKYDKVLLCTGSQANQLSVPGAELPGIYTLRTLADSRKIKKAAQDAQKVTVIGSSFIGLEVATSIQELGCEVTVVAPEKVPFSDRWGEPVGKLIRDLHDQNGTHFELETKVKEFRGNNRVEEVVLENGRTLKTDLVVVGIGVKPATQYLSGLTTADDGGIPVDDQLRAAEDVYVAGDIAQFPYRGQSTRIEHWRVACQQGRVAGYNMAGRSETYRSVPFFWTAQQGTNFRYLGHVKDFDDVIYEGSVEDQEFMAYYLKDGKVGAILGVSRDQAMAAAEHLLYHDRMPASERLRQGVDLLDYLKQT